MDHLERNLEKAKLQYIEEHLRCDHYCQGDKSSLAIYELDTGECLVREHIMRSAIFFVTKGQISLPSMKDDNLIPAGHFYLKPAGSYFYCKAEEPSTIIRMSLDVDITFCNKLHIRDLKNHLTKPFTPPCDIAHSRASRAGIGGHENGPCLQLDVRSLPRSQGQCAAHSAAGILLQGGVGQVVLACRDI